MLENIVQMMLPLALQKLAELPVNQKRAITWYIMLLAQAFYTDDKPQFVEYLKSVPLPENIKNELVKAMWNGNNEGKG